MAPDVVRGHALIRYAVVNGSVPTSAERHRRPSVAASLAGHYVAAACLAQLGALPSAAARNFAVAGAARLAVVHSAGLLQQVASAAGLAPDNAEPVPAAAVAPDNAVPVSAARVAPDSWGQTAVPPVVQAAKLAGAAYTLRRTNAMQQVAAGWPHCAPSQDSTR